MRCRPKFERSVESDYSHHSGDLGVCSRRLDKMSVAAVHPDSASLELHMDIGTPEFAKLAHLLTLTKIGMLRPAEPKGARAVVDQGGHARRRSTRDTLPSLLLFGY